MKIWSLLGALLLSLSARGAMVSENNGWRDLWLNCYATEIESILHAAKVDGIDFKNYRVTKALPAGWTENRSFVLTNDEGHEIRAYFTRMLDHSHVRVFDVKRGENVRHYQCSLNVSFNYNDVNALRVVENSNPSNEYYTIKGRIPSSQRLHRFPR